MPNQDFDNIIIKLTEFSKSQYVNSHILYPDNFDVRGNKMPFEYSKEQRRGNMKYIPPLGWIGIGLNITGYPDWEIRCGHCNKEGEWCVAYHGTDIENAKNIIIEGLKPGKRQAYKDRIDKEGDKIGEGVYFSPLIEVAEYYSNPKKGIEITALKWSHSGDYMLTVDDENTMIIWQSVFSDIARLLVIIQMVAIPKYTKFLLPQQIANL